MKKSSLLSLLFFLIPLAPAQTGQQPPAQTTPPPAHTDQQQGPKKPASDQEKTPEKEHKITPEEAKELFKSVDQILRFASQDTLLPFKHPVKKAMVSRDEVEKYIGDKFKDDVDRIRFERSELVLKKFGLLPRQFKLHDFLIKLLGEQVAGYYDEKKKTINLLDWVALDMQKPVMAHELTHALQDQSFDLEKMVKKDEEIEKRGPEDFNALIQIDEESTARTAIMEGQAMIVFADYVLNTMDTDNSCSDDPSCPIPDKRSVADFPKFVDLMLSQMDKEKGDSLIDNAPLLLREELLFPYSQGMKFIARLLTSGGKQSAFTQVVKRMPKTSREIMEPEEYLAGRVVPPLLLPDFKFLREDFEAFDAGAVGQLDVSILLKQYTEDAIADRLSKEWRGGSYYAVGRRGAKPPDANSTAHVGLIYVSKWSNESAAQEFAKIYASSLPQRYSKVEHPQRDGPPGRDKYLTADGPIYIQQTGSLVVAVESFEDSVSEKLVQAVLAQQAQPQQAAK
ncbi:MAG TPA: hypothetical protein VKY85_24470 [Candidatus Angelobacter sp.]|nr:hypothetical protein [Candidatus Angelobacter sp.]